jgi:hypothetical protein
MGAVVKLAHGYRLYVKGACEIPCEWLISQYEGLGLA